MHVPGEDAQHIYQATVQTQHISWFLLLLLFHHLLLGWQE
jgi:hypothetical protein